MEIIFRAHAEILQDHSDACGTIAMDGKVLRGSVDHFKECKAIQMLSAFASESKLVLGHIWMTNEDGKKEHEIQAAQKLIQELELSEQLFTFDALHMQKKQ